MQRVPDPDKRETVSEDVVLGPHAVLEALRSGRRNIERILVARERPDPRIAEIMRLATARGVPVQHHKKGQRSEAHGNLAHQGIMAVVSRAAYEDPLELVARIVATASLPLLVLLDGIQDPQNLGAIVRTAEAAGADGLFISKHRAAGVTAAVARASSGAVEYLPMAKVAGIPNFLEWLKKQGIWVLGADPGVARTMYEIDLRVPLALVIGAEHRGLSALVRERCDLLASIPLRGRVSSLNAAAAAAVILFEIRRQRDCRSHSVAN